MNHKWTFTTTSQLWTCHRCGVLATPKADAEQCGVETNPAGQALDDSQVSGGAEQRSEVKDLPPSVDTVNQGLRASQGTTPSPSADQAVGRQQPRSANRTHVPELEGWAVNQRPKTRDHSDVRLLRYEGTDLYQWYSKRGLSVFSDPVGEPFVIEGAAALPAQAGPTQRYDPQNPSVDADLLEALKEVLVWISNWDPNFTQDDDWPAARKLMEAAIARAESSQEDLGADNGSPTSRRGSHITDDGGEA